MNGSQLWLFAPARRSPPVRACGPDNSRLVGQVSVEGAILARARELTWASQTRVPNRLAEAFSALWLRWVPASSCFVYDAGKRAQRTVTKQRGGRAGVARSKLKVRSQRADSTQANERAHARTSLGSSAGVRTGAQTSARYQVHCRTAENNRQAS